MTIRLRAMVMIPSCTGCSLSPVHSGISLSTAHRAIPAAIPSAAPPTPARYAYPRQAREERGVVQVKIAAAIEVNQATIARFEDGIAWPRQPEEVLMAYASELDMDVRLLWLHAFVPWLEHEPVLDKESQEQIRVALKRLKI